MSGSVMMYSIIIIGLIAALTYAARLFPYVIFGRGSKIPDLVIFLGEVLPPAVMVLLIVYCIRNISIFVYPYGIPEFSAILLTVILYLTIKNNLVAMISGTILYMILIQAVFV